MESTEINGVPSIASDAVLIKSEKMPAGTPIVKGIHVEAKRCWSFLFNHFSNRRKGLNLPNIF